MATGWSFLLLTAILVFSLLQDPASANKKSYVVYLGAHAHGHKATLEDYERVTDSHLEFLGSFLGSKEEARAEMFYSYTKHINGFAATLEEEQAQISKHPEVISVFENKAMQLHTTRTWDMVLMEIDGRVPPSSIWAHAKFGNDTIIAHLDSGVWPESESFNDKGMGPVPSRWRGFCQNNTKEGLPCNRKLIGARYFVKGFEAEGGKVVNPSARDTVGHGTHTLSTAAGRFVPGAGFFGSAKGTAKGGSPDARVASYKVCWEGCFPADILSAFDAAIHDGVDVLLVSLGSLKPLAYLADPIAIGSFHAVANGITVVCSAGNSGPDEGTVTNIAPWIITVGASTIDRDFPSFLTLGNKKRIKGLSLSSEVLPANKFYPLINASDANRANVSASEAAYCYLDSLDPNKVKGKIVACLRWETGRLVKGLVVQKAGGVGMILVNDRESGSTLFADPHLLPATMISYTDGVALFKYINSTKSPVASISAPETELGTKPAPVMASFSSRGPNVVSQQILKPDITAPGVNVLAAFSGAVSATALPEDNRHVPFNFLSGTSMSCPHVAGVAGLLETLHPDWSPAAIRSAIMTTARTRDNTRSPLKDLDFGSAKANPFAYGSGHIRPNRAMDPGLIFDLTTTDYLNFLCAFGYDSTQLALLIKKAYDCPTTPIKMEDLNYPSIAAPNVTKATFTVTRTMKNVGSPGTYKVRVKPPYAITTKVKPEILKFDKVGEEKAFEVTFLPQEGSIGRGYLFGGLIWSDGKHHVRIPLAVNAFSKGNWGKSQ